MNPGIDRRNDGKMPEKVWSGALGVPFNSRRATQTMDEGVEPPLGWNRGLSAAPKPTANRFAVNNS